MKLQVELPFSNTEGSKDIYCDVGRIVECTDQNDKKVITIEVDPTKEEEIKKILFKKKPLSMGCHVYRGHCDFCDYKG
jgi:hypothetical protein